MYLASVNKTPFTPVFDTLSDLKDNTYNPKDTVNYKYNFKRFGVWFFFLMKNLSRVTLLKHSKLLSTINLLNLYIVLTFFNCHYLQLVEGGQYLVEIKDDYQISVKSSHAVISHLGFLIHIQNVNFINDHKN